MKLFKLHSTLLVGAICLLFTAAWGDSLELKNGSLIKGQYLGGTETEISFRVGSTVQRYAVDDVVSVRFDDDTRTATAPEAPPPPSPPQVAPRLVPRPPQSVPAPRPPQGEPVVASSNTAPSAVGSVTVPSGTRIMVRTVDAIDSDRNQIGDKFQASLEQPLIVDDVTVAPKGTSVYGRLTQATEAGRIQGRSQLKLELTGIVVNGQTIPLVTGDYSASGASRGATTAKRVGGGAAVGALIGAIAGGGKGAAIGAGVGAGAGTAVQVMTKGEQVKVPSETLLEFSLQQDVRMPVASTSTVPAS